MWLTPVFRPSDPDDSVVWLRPYLVLLAGDDESRRLVDVDLLQVAIEKGRLDVHVVDAPALLGCQCDEATRGLHPCDWCEGTVKVDALLLHEPVCNQSGLVLDDCAASSFFSLNTHLRVIAR